MKSYLSIATLLGLSACSSVPTTPEAAAPPDAAVAAAEATAQPVTPDVTTMPPADTTPSAVSASTPEQAPPQVTGTPPSDSYTVQAGDTLMKIAFDTTGDLYQWKKIYEANKDKIPNPAALSAGTVLQIEKPAIPVVITRNGDKYLIKLGDTLGTISGDVYGTMKKWKRLWENNSQMIKNPNLIFAGFYLYYTMTEEDRKELESLKQQIKPAPIAAASAPLPRAPASAEAAAPAAPPAQQSK